MLASRLAANFYSLMRHFVASHFRYLTASKRIMYNLRSCEDTSLFFLCRSSRRHGYSVVKAGDDIEAKETLTSLFAFLNACMWNFIDCHLLGHIIDELGGEDLKKHMSQYERNLEVFKSHTSIADLLECWPAVAGHDAKELHGENSKALHSG